MVSSDNFTQKPIITFIRAAQEKTKPWKDWVLGNSVGMFGTQRSTSLLTI